MIPAIGAIAGTAGADLKALQTAKLKKGARDFEAMLIQQLWKGSKDEDSQGGNGTLTDLSIQTMSQGMAAHGGLGIARMIEKSLK